MDYNVQSNIKKTVFSDIKEITNTNVDWNRFNGKTVLITGAGGFIGYYLVLTFLARNDFYMPVFCTVLLRRLSVVL